MDKKKEKPNPCTRQGCPTPALYGSAFCRAHGGRVAVPVKDDV